jgi:hypothetical protein
MKVIVVVVVTMMMIVAVVRETVAVLRKPRRHCVAVH